MRTFLRFPPRSFAWASLAIAVAALAIAVRWSHISSLPFDFHPARQYHSANLARAYYAAVSDELPEWKKDVARANLRQDPPIELPIIELTAAAAYKTYGSEELVLPRLFSSLFWIAGGLFLFLVARRLMPAWAALLAVGTYLFLPFVVTASTSFQPDPLMVAALLGAAFAAVRHHEERTTRRAVVAVVAAAFAILVKPGIAAFFLFPLFAGLAAARDGVRRTLSSPFTYALPALAFMPAGLLYAYSVLTGEFLAGHVESKTNVALLSDGEYWRGWGENVLTVLRPPFFPQSFGLLVLGVALAAVVLARTAVQRAVLWSLWAGYALYGLVFTNHISSHNYYSLPLVPIVALSVGLVAAVLLRRVPRVLARNRTAGIAVAAGVCTVAAAAVAAVGLPSLPGHDPLFERRVAVYERIGALVGHSPRVLVLERVGGLWYHGWIAGRYWPNRGDLDWERGRDGLQPIGAEERFETTDERYYPAVGAMEPPPSFFIVSEPIELALQPDLSVLLSRFPVLAESPDFVIFDLRRGGTAVAARGVHERRRRTRTVIHDAVLHSFPPAWRSVRPGIAAEAVMRAVGRPRRVATLRHLQTPFQTWFYGRPDDYVVILVGGRVLALARAPDRDQ